MGRNAERRDLILVVDDDPVIRALMSSVLRQAGFEVVEAADGEEALASARRERPRAATLDVNLPRLSGYEVCHELRNEFGDDMAIVFVSGARTESYDRVAGLLLGADDYLVKPFAPDELVARVRRLIERSFPSPLKRLTGREREVLELLASGLDQAEIAARLVISPRTVGSHIEHVRTKLGVRSRAQAVAIAYRAGAMNMSGDGADGNHPRAIDNRQ